jgi:hypothetical protein
MKLAQIETVVDLHEQKYRNSCSPSLAEMMLKVDGAVASDYYDEQHRDMDSNVGLANIQNKTIAGKTFRHVKDIQSSKPFRGRIEDLLGAERPVGIYLPTPFGCHGFVVAGRQGGNYVLLAKFSEEGHGEGRITLKVLLPEADLDQFHARDCIYIE